MRPRTVDWLLFALVTAETITGFITFTLGAVDQHWFFILHGMLGLALVVLVYWKVQRVWVRLTGPNRRELTALASVMAARRSAAYLWHWPRLDLLSGAARLSQRYYAACALWFTPALFHGLAHGRALQTVACAGPAWSAQCCPFSRDARHRRRRLAKSTDGESGACAAGRQSSLHRFTRS